VVGRVFTNLSGRRPWSTTASLDGEGLRVYLVGIESQRRPSLGCRFAPDLA